MEDSKKLLILIVQLQVNNIFLKTDDLGNRFNVFFNEKINSTNIMNCVSSLEKENLIILNEGVISATYNGLENGNRAHVKYYFSEGVKKSEESNAEKVYRRNKNGGIVNSDSIVDEAQLDYMISELRNTGEPVFDLGCGRGEISSYIQERIETSVIGIDASDDMLSVARNSKPDMTWELRNIEDIKERKKSAGAYILVDSVYFVKDKKQLFERLFNNLKYGGKIIVTFSEYIENVKNVDSLDPEKNKLGETFKSLSIPFTYKDFTENEVALWELREKLVDSLKGEYTRECCEYLYYDKKTEASQLLGVLRQGLGRRYIYVVEKIRT